MILEPVPENERASTDRCWPNPRADTEQSVTTGAGLTIGEEQLRIDF
jgi:hypothetical protein